jgi:CRP/FNR family transcriptional regulator, cyclic AMP receptor protein
MMCTSSGCLTRLPGMDVLEFCETLPLRTFGPQEVVVEDGRRCGLLFILVSGAVEVLKGGVQVSTISQPGAFLGEMSVLLDAPHMASVRTLESSTFHVADDPEAFLRSNPAIAMELARMLAGKLNLVTSYLADLKQQFADSGDHLEMVDEVLEGLLHHQDRKALPVSDRCPDPIGDD